MRRSSVAEYLRREGRCRCRHSECEVAGNMGLNHGVCMITDWRREAVKQVEEGSGRRQDGRTGPTVGVEEGRCREDPASRAL